MTRGVGPEALVRGPGAVRCTTCGDIAESVRVVRADPGAGLALCVDDSGHELTVQTELVGPVAAGEVLLVHAGTALAREA
jgi:hypothetical protein